MCCDCTRAIASRGENFHGGRFGDSVAEGFSCEATAIVVGSRANGRTIEFQLVQSACGVVGALGDRTVRVGDLGQFPSGIVFTGNRVGLAANGECLGSLPPYGSNV